jgi:hypothetical protein
MSDLIVGKGSCLRHSAGKKRKSCILKEWKILKRQISEYRILTTAGSLQESATKWD